MSYIIQCGDGYIARNKNNSFYVAANETEAFKIADEQKAINIMTRLPKAVRTNNEQLIEIVDLASTVNNQYVPIDMSHVKELICNLSDQFKAMKGNKEWLLEMESNVDKEISDILHYIEFYSFNACDGYKLAKELKNLRLKRRDIKNQLEVINIISNHTCNMLADGKTNKALCNIENKQYTPRVLTEIFEARQI